MKNDFIRVVLNSRNELRAEASLSINGLTFINVDVKIDTGCPKTSFPLLRMGVLDKDAYSMKLKDCSDPSVAKSISFGVNDSNQKKEEDKRKFKAHRYMDLYSISFRHIAKDLSIDGVLLGDYDVSVSYDRVGNILIGMDILQTLEIHMGRIGTGEIVMLACPKNNITQGYRDELNNLFDVRRIS